MLMVYLSVGLMIWPEKSILFSPSTLMNPPSRSSMDSLNIVNFRPFWVNILGELGAKEEKSNSVAAAWFV